MERNVSGRKLAEIREMAEVGRKSKCEFVWTIHPFMSDRITESNYDDSLATIKRNSSSSMMQEYAVLVCWLMMQEEYL